MSGFGYEDVVFNSDAELAGDVYAGLDCDDLACLEFASCRGHLARASRAGRPRHGAAFVLSFQEW